MELGKHVINEDSFVLIQKYDSKEPDAARFEAHRDYVDIQYVVEGMESIESAAVTAMTVTENYDPERDVEFNCRQEKGRRNAFPFLLFHDKVLVI